MKAAPVLLQVLRQPQVMRALDGAQWDLLVRQARSANLLATLHAWVDDEELRDCVPAPLLRHLDWAGTVAERHRDAVAWEVAQIGQALAATGVMPILLKGAAYTLAGLPAARGRLYGDVDILVPEAALGPVEAALMQGGWVGTELDPYDQRYYRSWMHELPPMQHLLRRTVIDVHHAILPRTARLQPSSAKLRAASVAIDGGDGLRVLAPADMVLHSATHLFLDGQCEQGLRDLVDLAQLLAHFGVAPGFWTALGTRAAELGLQRPLFYALRYCAIVLQAPLPAHVLQQAKAGSPGRVVLAVMDALYLRVLRPMHASCASPLASVARALLYVRATWLRMPPLPLARHLLHQALRGDRVTP
jgi:hypothetical protein